MEEINKEGENKKDFGGAPWWQPAVMMFARFSGWIVAPVIIGAVIGIWLDKKFNTDPWLFLVCVGAAFIVSMIGLVKNATEEYRKIDQDNKTMPISPARQPDRQAGGQTDKQVKK